MRNFLKKLVDSGDSEVEAHLVLLCLGAVTLIGLSIYHVVCLQHAFDPDPYGQGLGCLLAGGGAAAWGQGLQRTAQGGKDKDDESGQ
ncbi:MAG: hypothetical protein P4M13_09605 [Alphaproteobacteria bacterium]|nr:hypothetical protein [Alphaproteobacteria bacterium]